MGLIASSRHSTLDLEAWSRLEEGDAVRATLASLARKEERAKAVIREFGMENTYVSVSWGKDSVTVAHLALQVFTDMQVTWFPAGAIENPDCALVRDAFLSRFRPTYDEIDASDHEVTYEGHDGAQEHFERVAKAYRPRYISGVRAEESGVRTMRMKSYGYSTTNTCAPIGWWTNEEVFAYLKKYDLPVHPAYACLMDGLYERKHIRVGTIGGVRGTGHGRRVWEARYYRQEIVRTFGEIPGYGT